MNRLAQSNLPPKARRARALKTLAWVLVLWLGVQAAAPAEAQAPPSVLFQELYARVEQQHLYPDDKTFADATPRRSPAVIMAVYRAHPPPTREGLAAFVAANFIVPTRSWAH